MTPQQRADASAQAMWIEDTAAQHAGMRLLEVRPGYARLEMRIRPEFTNGLGMCHGGYMFLLADTAFAYSCNTRNQRAVAAGATIEFLASAQRGELLTAESQEQHHAGRTGVYDVRVTTQGGTLVALFRGKSATIKGHFFEEHPK
jgi:acyl-CoA thioesterase